MQVTAHCWPIHRYTRLPPATSIASAVSNTVLDTPTRLRTFSRKVEEIVHEKLNHEDKGMVYELIDLFAETLTKYKDIAPRAQSLRDGKIRKEQKRSRHVGEARVLTYQYVNGGVRKAAEANAAKAVEKRVAAQKKESQKRRRPPEGPLTRTM